MSKLLFIDTNIYLDFYRIRNDVKVSFLKYLEVIKDTLIVTDQVEVEYKSNRQSVIQERSNELKSPKRLNVPTILENDELSIELKNDYKTIEDKIKTLKTKLNNILEDPIQYDEVYKVLQRLFCKKQDIDLYRTNKKRSEVKELAHQRFILGYPPRKKNDTSIGDAINWEWLIYVANKKDADIWIVSRDSDYGLFQGGKGIIKDWLNQEFRERTNKKQKIVLCPILANALKEFGISVSPEEEKEEEKVIESKSLSINVTDTLSFNDTPTAILYRRCEKCGTSFEVQENKRVCPNCTKT